MTRPREGPRHAASEPAAGKWANGPVTPGSPLHRLLQLIATRIVEDRRKEREATPAPNLPKPPQRTKGDRERGPEEGKGGARGH
jgi:hypothetical protein